jgi:large subunit ribosomal protein L32
MGPLPKRKVSKSRRNRRRAHDSLSLNHLVVCETCGEYHISHRVCPKCGSYKGESVVNIKDE